MRTRYYACNGYVSKGNAICQRSVIGQDALENGVLDQIDDTIQRHVRQGGGGELRSMIRQELKATASREEAQSGVTLEAIAARQREISEKVSAVLAGINEANHVFVNAHLGSLRLESEDLTRQEEDLRRQAAQREMLDAAVEAQYSLARQRIQMARDVLLAGSIAEQRLIIRAFLRKIRFDPDARTGTAEFWLVPGTRVFSMVRLFGRWPGLMISTRLPVAGSLYFAPAQ